MAFNRIMYLARLAAPAVFVAAFLELALPAAAADAPYDGERCVGLVCIEVVEVGDAGNAPDPGTGEGAVAHDFAIGKYEVTVAQYLIFLNAVASRAAELPVGKREAIEGLWQEDMFETHAYVAPRGVIARSGSGTVSDPYVYSEVPAPELGPLSSRRGVLNISWLAAARFANWLHNGATATSDTETGAYSLDYRTKGGAVRNPGARWWIPSNDEWYKAAFYDPGRPGTAKYWTYPSQSDELPRAEVPPGGTNSANFNGAGPEGQKLTPVGAYAGTSSHYGTYDQAGLLWEWSDTPVLNHDGVPETMGLLGGSWSLGLINVSKFGGRDYLPDYNDDDTGFRLATTGGNAP